ncbi:MAG: radical SAM protein [Candidatus Sumerlaeota bacterium]|nr:radical SAM protein [Candidatus Sumerlaeota bacterium]
MKILLVYPEVAVPVRWTELLGMGILSALAKQSKHAVDFLYYKHPGQLASIAKAIPALGARLIVVHLAWDQWKAALPLMREIKKAAPRTPLVAEGPFPTLDPDTAIAEPAVDMLALGESEPALMEMIHKMGRGEPPESLQNFWINHRDGRLTKNPLRMLIENLDTLPFPDRSLYDHAALTRATGAGLPMLAGRGCPYNCLFCYMPRLKQAAGGKGAFARARSPMSLAAETLDIAKRERIEWVDFVDEYFPQEVEWIGQFCASWRTQARLPFRFTGMAERLTPQALEQLREAGCERIRLGVETGNEKFRARVADRNLSNERLRAICEEAARLGIEIQTCNMVGLPLENPDLARETVEFNRKLKPSAVSVSIYRPIVGTQLHEFCESKGYLVETDPADCNPRRPALRLPAIGEADVLAAYDDLRLLDEQARIERRGETAGYVGLLGERPTAKVESAFEPALAVEEFASGGERRLCLLQALGTRAAFPVLLRDNSVFSFGLALGPSPFGLRHSRPVKVEIAVRQGEDEETVFLKILQPAERRTRRPWFDYQAPLIEWEAGPAEIILTAALMEGKAPAPIYVAWSQPCLIDRREQGPAPAPSASASRRIAALESEVARLREESQKLQAEAAELREDIDRRKARSAELTVRQLGLGQELEALRKEKAEWTRLREEMENSVGEKIKRLFKRE